MAMVTLKSTSKANLSQTFPFDNNNKKNRDASFSSYLNSNEETLVHKLADQSSEEHNNHLATKKEEDEEIGVFGAEKYFNGVMDEETSPKSGSSSKKYHHNTEKRVTLDPMKKKIQPETPSVRSESSWNSRSSLLQSRLRNPYQSNTSKAQRQRKSFFASLGCKCSCSDKNSVDVDEHVGEISFNKNNGATASSGTLVHGKASPTSPINNTPPGIVDPVSEALVEMNNSQKLNKLGVGLSRENCFTFPTSRPGMGSLPVKMPFEEEEAEKVRKSLEVFGSPVFEKRNKSLGLDKRLKMLPWNEFPANSGGVIYNNESDSDASSDLFEIESLTGKANPFLARQASDAATSGCMTPTTCYAPSEASIEWSVVTASVADFSVMSDCEDQQRPSPMKMVPNNTRNTKARMNKDIPRHRPATLLGCKSQKAVKVAGDAHKTYHHEKTNFDQQMMRRSRPESFVLATRFQAETSPNKLTGFDSRVQGQHALAVQSLPRSHSPHASHLLFM